MNRHKAIVGKEPDAMSLCMPGSRVERYQTKEGKYLDATGPCTK